MAEKQEENDGPGLTLSLGEQIGQGAFGSVHMAQVKETGEIVAIKLVQHLSTPIAVLQRISLLQEVVLLKTLQHPHIVKYVGVYDRKGMSGLVLEYMSGGSVAAQLKRYGPFTEAVCEKYTTHILMGLNYLHNRNVIHRDIKCGNILLDGNAVAKLADFGISKHIESSLIACSLGTVHYMAPELHADKSYNKTADTWSVGCALMEMLTGDLPWKESSSQEAVRRILNFTFDKEISPYLPKNASKNIQEFLLKCFLPKEMRWDAEHLLQHDFCKKYRVKEVEESKLANVSLSNPVRDLIKLLSNTSLNNHQEWDIIKYALNKISKMDESTSREEIYKMLSCLYFEWVQPDKLKSLLRATDIIPHHGILKLIVMDALKYQTLTGISSAPKNKNSIVRPKQRRPFIGLIGGSGTDDEKLLYKECEVFSITGDQTILKIPDLPIESTAKTIVSDENGDLYKVGGRRSEDGRIKSSVLKYKVNAGKWITLPPMQVPRSRHVAVYVKGHIVIFGGTFQPTVFEIFNTKDCTWQRKENFPFLLVHAAGCECDGDVFACGGITKGDDDAMLHKGILRYLFEDNSWNTVGRMIHFRRDHVMAAVNHKIYIAGGEDTTTSAEMFDPATGQSSLLPEMPYGCFSTTMVSYQHFLITLSLDGENPEKKHVVIYNTETSKWYDFDITLPRKYDTAHLALVNL